MVSSDPRSGRYPDPNRRPSFHRPGLFPPASPSSNSTQNPASRPPGKTAKPAEPTGIDLPATNPVKPHSAQPTSFADTLAAAQAALAQAAARQAYGEPGPKTDNPPNNPASNACHHQAAKSHPHASHSNPAPTGKPPSPDQPGKLPRLAPGQLRLTSQPDSEPPIQIPPTTAGPARHANTPWPGDPGTQPTSKSSSKSSSNPASPPAPTTGNGSPSRPTRDATHNAAINQSTPHSTPQPAATPLRPPTAASSHHPAGGGASSLPPHLQTLGQPINSATDPRWVLALRTAEALQGPLLTPEKRQLLVRLGKTMGLTAFDANLVIAIIQDQARRGYAPDYCPTAGEPQLQMVPLPTPSPLRPTATGMRALTLAITIATILAAEILLIKWWLGA